IMILDVQLTGKDIIELLESLLNEHAHVIKMDSIWTPSNNTIDFLAKETFWHDLICHGIPNYVATKNHMNAFKEIEIKCNTNEVFEVIESTFIAGKTHIDQKEILKYLKDFYEKHSTKYRMALICTCLKKEQVILEYEQPENEIMLLKLTCSIE
ncbi:unnamed protein product, partial [Didymodactylos carnosus]